jgi:hypothetical protein
MATQRLTIATIAGVAGEFVLDRFREWQALHSAGKWSRELRSAVDQFHDRVKENQAVPPVIYFAEWIDHWSMGDKILGQGAVSGSRFEVWCGSLDEASKWAESCGDQFQEDQWLRARLREAADAWQLLASAGKIVIFREVLDGSITDERIQTSLDDVPDWLT